MTVLDKYTTQNIRLKNRVGMAPMTRGAHKNSPGLTEVAFVFSENHF